MEHKKSLEVAQEAAGRAADRMLQMLIGYEPAQSLTVADVKFISEWTRTLAFDATEKFREQP